MFFSDITLQFSFFFYDVLGTGLMIDSQNEFRSVLSLAIFWNSKNC